MSARISTLFKNPQEKPFDPNNRPSGSVGFTLNEPSQVVITCEGSAEVNGDISTVLALYLRDHQRSVEYLIASSEKSSFGNQSCWAGTTVYLPVGGYTYYAIWQAVAGQVGSPQTSVKHDVIAADSGGFDIRLENKGGPIWALMSFMKSRAFNVFAEYKCHVKGWQSIALTAWDVDKGALITEAIPKPDYTKGDHSMYSELRPVITNGANRVVIEGVPNNSDSDSYYFRVYITTKPTL